MKVLSTLLASAAMVACASVAHARGAPTPTGPESNDQSGPSTTVGAVIDAQAAEAADQGGLRDIVVTAQRRAENLQRAAIAISAVSGDALVASGVSDTASLGRLVPSLVVTPTGGSGTSFYIRGVGTLQGNAFGENPIAFNYGGVYVARPNAPIGTFYDLERVEVLKGPQGTLYGRNATGGAINVLPKKPTLDGISGQGTVEYGNYDARKVSAAVNLPLSSSLALRVAGQLVDRDGYLSDGYDDEQGEAARVSLLFRPAGDWSALFVADYFHQGGRGVGGVLAPGAAYGNPSGFSYPGYAAPALEDRIGGSDPRSIAALRASPAPAPAFLANGFVVPPRSDGYNDSKFYGISATIEGDLGFGTLTVQPAYRRSEPNFVFYQTGFRGAVSEQDDQMSLEVRLSSNGDTRLRYVLGGYLFNEHQNASNIFYQGLLADTRSRPILMTESKAVFGQLTFDITDTLRAVGGVRYTDESKDANISIQLFGPGGQTANVSRVSGLDFSRVTWKAGFEADLGPRSLLYANVATGFKAGGFFLGSVDNTFDPETLTAYTFGSKNRFFDNKLQVNLEAFYWKYKDQQISFVGPVQINPGVFTAGGKTVNAGNARFFGAELEVQFAPTSSDVFSGNVQYNNSKYSSLQFVAISGSGGPIRAGCPASLDTSTPVAAPSRLFLIDCSGQSALNAPRWSGSASYEHTFALGSGYDLVAGARTRLATGYYVSLEYLPELHEPGYMQSDLFLTLQGPDDRWSLTGFVNNVENETIISGGISRPILQTVYVTLAPPRTYGARASFKF